MTPVYSFLLALRAGEMPTAMMFGGPHVIRTRIRTERKIKGSIAGDCCVTYWCFYCGILRHFLLLNKRLIHFKLKP